MTPRQVVDGWELVLERSRQIVIELDKTEDPEYIELLLEMYREVFR